MRLTVYIVITLAAIGMMSCRNASTLATSVTGTWEGEPEALSLPYGGVGTVSLSYDFKRGCDENGGSVELTASYDVPALTPGERTDRGRKAAVSTVSVATIQGTWQAIDADEMELHLDPATLNCSIDPTTVELIKQHKSSKAHPAPEAFVAGDTVLLKQDFVQTMSRLVNPNQRFSQIQVNDGMMRWNVNGKYRVLVKPRAEVVADAG